jgi:cytochrome c556
LGRRGQFVPNILEGDPVTNLEEMLCLKRGIAVAIAALLACLLATGIVATAQDKSQDQSSIARDAIFARKSLMNAVMDHMDQIGEMISSQQIEVREANRHADTIEVMFMAFPHLFPPASNQWKEDVDLDPVSDTIASPDIWTDFADFYRRSAVAANTAHELSRADSEDEVKRLYRALGVACDTCHAIYMKE